MWRQGGQQVQHAIHVCVEQREDEVGLVSRASTPFNIKPYRPVALGDGCSLWSTWAAPVQATLSITADLMEGLSLDQCVQQMVPSQRCSVAERWPVCLRT